VRSTLSRSPATRRLTPARAGGPAHAERPPAGARHLPSWRLWLALALGAAILFGCNRAPALAGTDLGALPAPDIVLPDQTGATMHLEALRGRPIVLTFLYTHCPDVCPLTAAKLKRVVDDLGAQAQDVALVAVSTDPDNDDAASATAFAEQFGLGDRLHFLLGDRGALAPVWAAYYVHAAPLPPDAPAEERAAAAYAGRTAVHTDALFVIDRLGRERTLLRSDFDPPALTSTLRTLLRE
jgi:protein SCO1/2